MTTTASTMQKYEVRLAREKQQLDFVSEIIRNPMVELIGGFVLVELLQRYPTDRPIIGNVQGTLMEAGMAGIIAVQQLSAALPFAQPGFVETVKAVAPAAMDLMALKGML